MKNLLKESTKTYELRQLEAKIGNMKKGIQASYMLSPNLLAR